MSDSSAGTTFHHGDRLRTRVGISDGDGSRPCLSGSCRCICLLFHRLRILNIYAGDSIGNNPPTKIKR